MIITLATVKSILQISDTSYDVLIAELIPEIQKDIVNYCNNSFLNRYVQYYGSTIAFTSTTITDSESGFVDALFFNGMDVKVFGSKLNDGIFEIKTVAAGALTTETTITQCQPTRVEAAKNLVYLTMVDFSRVSKFKVAMLMKYYLAREGKLVNSESLPGGYSANFKSDPEIWKPFNEYRLL